MHMPFTRGGRLIERDLGGRLEDEEHFWGQYDLLMDIWGHHDLLTGLWRQYDLLSDNLRQYDLLTLVL